MCWKFEWARAVNNLSYAITHVERARRKIHKRLLRNQRTLRVYKNSKKYNYPGCFAPVEALIKKNSEAELKCKLLISEFRDLQKELRRMIKTYGIKMVSKKSRVAERLMRGRRVKKNGETVEGEVLNFMT